MKYPLILQIILISESECARVQLEHLRDGFVFPRTDTNIIMQNDSNAHVIDPLLRDAESVPTSTTISTDFPSSSSSSSSSSIDPISKNVTDSHISLLWMISEPPMYIRSCLHAQHKRHILPQSRNASPIPENNIFHQNENKNENDEDDLHSSPGNFMPMKGHFPFFSSTSGMRNASNISDGIKSTQHAINIGKWKSKRIEVDLIFLLSTLPY